MYGMFVQQTFTFVFENKSNQISFGWLVHTAMHTCNMTCYLCCRSSKRGIYTQCNTRTCTLRQQHQLFTDCGSFVNLVVFSRVKVKLCSLHFVLDCDGFFILVRFFGFARFSSFFFVEKGFPRNCTKMSKQNVGYLSKEI